jgi:hypothetical protein
VTDARMPRWFWLLPALAAAAWWPDAPYWQSDDFLAIQYANNGARALADFAGPQYGATDVWSFWRPLITASFWLDQQLGGPFPPVSHVSNVLAHALSALLVAAVWRRFLRPASAFVGALLWALLPTHQGSICWAVGRVDSHTTVWCLLAVLLALRSAERGERTDWRLFAATAAALLSKESALVLPALATLAAAARLPAGERWPRALALTRGAWIAWLAYLPLRFVVLGRFGGYDAATFDPVAALRGLATALAQVGAPLRWIGVPAELPGAPGLWLTAAALPVALAVLTAIAHRPRLALLAALAYLVAVAPVAGFLAAADNPQTLRLQYLPAVALVGLVASAGPWHALAAIVALAWPFVAMRAEQAVADAQSATMHRALLREAGDGVAEPLFVTGLPHTNARGSIVQLHFGVDRMLQPPFTARSHRLCALRPLATSDSAFRLELVDGVPRALPNGSTWHFETPTVLAQVPLHDDLPALPIAGLVDGGVDLTSAQLHAMLPTGAVGPRLQTPQVRTPHYRLTVFTGGGYLATLFANHAPANASDGVVDFRAWFAGGPAGEAARYGIGGAEFVGEALVVPTTMDLSPAFPALLEAGAVDANGVFRATHRARRLFELRFDRGYPAWARRAQGRG